jgi:transposase
VAGFISERWPASNRYAWPECVGIRTGANPPPVDVKSLHAKIGELTLENDFLEVALGKAGLLSAKR